MKHTWLKLLTSLLWSQKFRGLPDNDHRIVYICHLIFAKMGLENEPISWLAATCFVTKYRYKIIVKNLITSGLFTCDGKVNGFEDSQLTPEAIRMRNYRERNQLRNSSRNSDANSDGDSRKQKAESSPPSEKKIPPTPRKRGERVPVEEIIGHLNRIAGTAFSSHSKATSRLIESRWAEGRRTEDFVRVIEAKTAEWGNDPAMRKYLRPETLFNATKMESYLGVIGAAGTSTPEFEKEPWL